MQFCKQSLTRTKMFKEKIKVFKLCLLLFITVPLTRSSKLAAPENEELVDTHSLSQPETSQFQNISATSIVTGSTFVSFKNQDGRNTKKHEAEINQMIHSRDNNDETKQAESENHTHFVFQNVCHESSQEIILLPDESNCSMYYEVCAKEHGLSISEILTLKLGFAKSCQKGTNFDSISAQCVMKDYAYCGTYQCSEPDGFFQDPISRHTFIHCFDGVPKRKSCEPKGTVFFNQTKTCIWLPEEIPIKLRIFQAFLWLVKLTEPDASEPQNGFISSNGDYLKMTALAVFIPLCYVFSIIALYMQIHPLLWKSTESSSFLTDAEDFYRHIRRPTRIRAANSSNETYFVTSSF